MLDVAKLRHIAFGENAHRALQPGPDVTGGAVPTSPQPSPPLKGGEGDDVVLVGFDARDQSCRRGIVRGRGLAFEFAQHRAGEPLAQFHAPLIE
jgi:hypothetical protein